MNILITGATGFLGQHLLDDLIPKADKVFLICRKGSEHKIKIKSEKIEIVTGDITLFNIVQDPKQLEEILQKVDTVVHAAAAYCLGDDDPTTYTSNVIGTQNVCNLAKDLKNLEAFHYISTYAVNSPFKRFNTENELSNDIDVLLNPYSKSKNLSEKYLRNFNFGKEICLRVYRPGVIIGHSQTGMIPKIDGPYYLFDLVGKLYPLLKKFHKSYIPFPYSKKALIPVIPVDIASQMITEIINSELASDTRIYHIIPPEKYYVSEIIDNAFRFYGIKVKLVPIPKTKANNFLMKLFDLPESLSSYFYSEGEFLTTNLLQDYPHFNKSIKTTINHTLSLYQSRYPL